MTSKKNPLNLNALQLKTLAILQELSQLEDWSTRDESSGEATIVALPHPHGDHFHVGRKVVRSRDANGLTNAGVWKALERKGLTKSPVFPLQLTLTPAGLNYDTGSVGTILHGSDH